MSSVKKPASLRLGLAGGRLNGAPKSTVTTGLVTVCLMSMAGVAPVLAETEAASGKDTGVIDTITVEGERIGSNPYADPDAPYKIDRSASSKFQDSLLDTAKSMTVIPKEVIEDSGAMSLKDVMRTQSGVTLGTGEGGNAFGDRIFIRGYDARNDVYIDGMRDPGVVSRETFAVEQIEVLKGPSSAFGGRGTTGGAVSLISKAPQSGTFQRAEATLGTDNTKRITGDVNFAVNDKFAVRLNGLWHDADVAGRDQVFDKRKGGAVAVAYQPTEKVGVKIDYYHLETDSLPDWGVPFDITREEPIKVDRSNFYGLVGRDYQKTKANIVTGKLEVDVNDRISLGSQLRYGATGNAYVVSAPERPDLDLGTVQANAKSRNQKNNYLISQSDMTAKFATGAMFHVMVAGVEFSHEKIRNTPPVVDPRSVTQDLYNPDPFNWNGTVTHGVARGKITVDTKAVYLIDTMTIDEHWKVFGGIRYDDYRVKLYAPPNDYSDEAVDKKNHSKLFNWHAGIVYKPVINGSIYATFASSSNPSGEQVDGSGDSYGGLSDDNASLDPERNKSYEIGVKWNVFNRHLNVTAALFQIDKENARVTLGPRGDTTTTLDGSQRVRGVELGLSGNIMPRWSLFGGLTLLDTKITDSPDPTQIGGKFPNIAETSFSLLTTYEILDGVKIGGQAYYSGPKYGGTAVAGDAHVPGYWRFDAMASYQMTQNIKLALNVLNVTDKVYYDALYRSRTPFSYIAPGRSALLTLGFDF